MQTIFLMDWYYDNTKGLLSEVPGWVTPDALLMNGRNHFPGCSKTKPFKLVVKPRHWYRLHVINSALFTAFSFAIQVGGHGTAQKTRRSTERMTELRWET